MKQSFAILSIYDVARRPFFAGHQRALSSYEFRSLELTYDLLFPSLHSTLSSYDFVIFVPSPRQPVDYDPYGKDYEIRKFIEAAKPELVFLHHPQETLFPDQEKILRDLGINIIIRSPSAHGFVSELIQYMMVLEKHSHLPSSMKFSVESSKIGIVLVHKRLKEVVSALRSLNLGSLEPHLRALDGVVAQLARVMKEDRSAHDSDKIFADALKNSLEILSRFFDLLDNKHSAGLIVAGAVAYLVSFGGHSAEVTYALSMAAWLGKDKFQMVVDAISGNSFGRIKEGEILISSGDSSAKK